MEAIEVFKSRMGLSQEGAIRFGSTLLKSQVTQPVGKSAKTAVGNKTGEDTFVNDTEKLHRLPCYHEPGMLKSYCIWEEDSTSDPFELVTILIHLLDNIETSSVDRSGNLNYERACVHRLFPLFEESVCELQKVDPSNLLINYKMAFALNVYRLMLRYGLLKLGVPVNETDRQYFLANIKFTIAGTKFYFDEWLDVMLNK